MADEADDEAEPPVGCWPCWPLRVRGRTLVPSTDYAFDDAFSSQHEPAAAGLKYSGGDAAAEPPAAEAHIAAEAPSPPYPVEPIRLEPPPTLQTPPKLDPPPSGLSAAQGDTSLARSPALAAAPLLDSSLSDASDDPDPLARSFKLPFARSGGMNRPAAGASRAQWSSEPSNQHHEQIARPAQFALATPPQQARHIADPSSAGPSASGAAPSETGTQGNASAAAPTGATVDDSPQIAPLLMAIEEQLIVEANAAASASANAAARPAHERSPHGSPEEQPQAHGATSTLDALLDADATGEEDAAREAADSLAVSLDSALNFRLGRPRHSGARKQKCVSFSLPYAGVDVGAQSFDVSALRRRAESAGMSEDVDWKSELGDAYMPPPVGLEPAFELPSGSSASVVVMRDASGELIVVKRIGLGGVKGRGTALLTNEVKLLAMLRHRHIVRFRGAFCEPRHLCILLDFCAGGSLNNAIDKQRERAARTSEGFETSTVTLWLAQLASAVLYMHSHGVLHRDISLNNVFLDFYANLVIGDLGLAKRVAVCSADTNDALAVTTCGTPDFLSPELVQGQPYGASSDAWAVGIVLFNLLSLERPFWHTSILGLARQSKAIRAPNSRLATRAYAHALSRLNSRTRPQSSPLRSCPTRRKLWPTAAIRRSSVRSPRPTASSTRHPRSE